MNNNSRGLFFEFRSGILSIIGWNFLSNIPRGAFNAILFMFVMSLSLMTLHGEGADYSNLWNQYWLYSGMFILYVLFAVIGHTNNFVKSYSIGSDLRLKLGAKLKRLGLGFFKSSDPGDVTSRMLHDVNKSEEVLSHNVPDIVSAVTVPVFIGLFLLFSDAGLTLLMFAVVAIAACFFLLSRWIIAVLGQKHLSALNEASSRILEYCRTIKTLKAFDMTGHGFKRLDAAMLDFKCLSFRTEVFAGIPVQIALLVIDCGYVSLLLAASYYYFEGSLELVKLLTFSVLGFYFFEPVKQLGVITVLLRHARHSTDRINEILKLPEPSFIHGRGVAESKSFELRDVSFKYSREKVLNGFSCVLPEKSVSALVGYSGSGKTTVANLLARFWDIDEGVIRYGGENIRNIDPDILLGDISFVFQDVFLFNDTVMNNIRVGRMCASDEEVIEAAKLAQCHDFVKRLPNEYDTVVSEGGNSLSGGEKQRISIARAILKDAPVVLLDEATASLDPENENTIQKAISNLLKEKTVIVIAHKFSTIVDADQILVLDEGKVKQRGTHAELVDEEGLYSELWQAQQKAGSWKLVNK